MNIGFNLLNKSIFKYFPYPWTVSTVHVIVGLIYCVGVYALGFKGASFGRVSGMGSEEGAGGRGQGAQQPSGDATPSRVEPDPRTHALVRYHARVHPLAPHGTFLTPTHPHPPCKQKQVISKDEFKSLVGPASMHAIGHIAANLSFAAVAISLTHTVKTLEPAFNVVLSRLVLGEATPLPALLSLIPIMVRAPPGEGGRGLRGRRWLQRGQPSCLTHPRPCAAAHA